MWGFYEYTPSTNSWRQIQPFLPNLLSLAGSATIRQGNSVLLVGGTNTYTHYSGQVYGIGPNQPFGILRKGSGEI